ncbi:MAG: cyclopropane-fatty-acyl-phospholipid synthase family protein [Salinibacter sp.]
MPRSSVCASLLGVALFVGLGPLPGWAQDRDGASPADSTASKDVPYVTTPQPVVERMLAMADVSADDVVYDLGSGDGRFVITAARQFGARGVGVEIDPQLVQEARAQARRAGVSDRVTFRQGNLFDVDLHEATVVTLYLEPALNLRLRPRLLLQLAPGDRVVSHDFGMGSWRPDRVEKMDGSTLYLWTIPSQLPDSLAR